MLRELTGVHTAASKLESQFGRLRTAALAAGAVFAGSLMIRGLVDATKHAEKLNHELVKLQIGARLSDAQTEAIGRDAFRVTRAAPGTTADEIVKQRRELYGVFGDMDVAKRLGDLTALGNVAISRYTDKRLDPQTALKALEISGKVSEGHKVSPELFRESYTALVRAIVASEGMLTGDDFLKFIKQAGPAARTMNLNALFGAMPEIMIGLGSERSGTAMMSLYQQMVGHVVAGKRVALAMQDAGMLQPGKWRVERGGKVVMDRNAVVDQKGFMDNPVVWLHDRLTELRKQRDKNGKPIDETRVIQDIFQLSSRATAARLISDIDANWATLQAYLARYKRMPDIPTITGEQNQKDLSANLQNLSAAWDNFMTALGKPGVPIMIGILSKLTDALNYLSEAVVNHPRIASMLFELAGGIAALTALGGGLVLLNLAWSPFVGGIRLLLGALTAAETTAAVATAGSLAGGITSLTGALVGAATAAANIAALVGAIALLVKLGSDSESAETRRKLDEINRKDRGTGFGPSQMRTYDQSGSGIDDRTGLPFPKAPAPNSAPRTPLLWGQRAGHVAYHPFDDRVMPEFIPSPRRSMRDGAVINVRVVEGQLRAHVTNGRDLQSGLMDHIGRALERPAPGTTGFDMRTNPYGALMGA